MTSGVRRPRVAPRQPNLWAVRSAVPAGLEASSVLISVLIVGGIVLGMALGIGPLVLVSSLSSLLIAVVTPYAGLAILAFMGPLLPPAFIPAPGFPSFLVGAILLGCIYRLPIDRPRLRLNAPLMLMVAFVLFLTVQQLPEMAAGYQSNADHAVGYLYFQMLTGLGAIIAAIWVLMDRSPFPILGMAVAGAVTGASVALVPNIAPALSGLFLGLAGHTDDLTRAVGAFGNPNFMGASSAISLAVAMGLLAIAKSGPLRVLLASAVLILACAVIISISRGALIAAFVGLLCVAISRGTRPAIAVIAVGLVGVLVIYPAFVEWRLVTIMGSASASAYQTTTASDAGRLTGVLAGFTLFLSSPIVGVGFGHYLAETAQIPGSLLAIGAHNWYTYVLGEQGIVGTILWMLLFALLLARLVRRPASARSVGLPVFGTIATTCFFLELPMSFQTFAVPAIVMVAVFACRWPVPGLADPSPGLARGLD